MTPQELLDSASRLAASYSARVRDLKTGDTLTIVPPGRDGKFLVAVARSRVIEESQIALVSPLGPHQAPAGLEAQRAAAEKTTKRCCFAGAFGGGEGAEENRAAL